MTTPTPENVDPGLAIGELMIRKGLVRPTPATVKAEMAVEQIDEARVIMREWTPVLMAKELARLRKLVADGVERERVLREQLARATAFVGRLSNRTLFRFEDEIESLGAGDFFAKFDHHWKEAKRAVERARAVTDAFPPKGEAHGTGK